MDLDALKAKGDAALAQISNALDDLQYSPDQRPVPLLHLAMDYVRDMLAILSARQEVAPVAGLERIEGMEFWLHENVDDDDSEPVRLVMAMSHNNKVFCHRASQGDNGICNYTSPAHTSEARDVLWTGWYHPDPDEKDDFMLYDAKDHRCDDCIRVHVIRAEDDAAMRQEAGND